MKKYGPSGSVLESLESDCRGQAREEETIRRQHPPHVGDHSREVRAVVGEMQQGAADDSVEGRIVPGEGVGFADDEPIARVGSSDGLRLALYAIDGARVAVDAEAVVTAGEQVMEIAAVATPHVQYTTAIVEPSARELIEKVDVDLVEQFLNRNARRDVTDGRHPG